MYEIQPIQETDKTGWRALVNGEPVDASFIELENPHIGTTITYGMRPEGYDGVVIHERGGGGAVTVPYFVHPDDGQVYIGTVLEERKTQGAYVWNVPRGMMDATDASHAETASREMLEETGSRVGRRVFQLASRVNSNSAVFDTSADGEGIAFYAVEFDIDELVAEGEHYRFPDGIKALDQTKTGERIVASRFKPIQELDHRDMFTMAGAGLLIRHMLAEQGVQKGNEATMESNAGFCSDEYFEHMKYSFGL